jgi:hypothetical protein
MYGTSRILHLFIFGQVQETSLRTLLMQLHDDELTKMKRLTMVLTSARQH